MPQIPLKTLFEETEKSEKFHEKRKMIFLSIHLALYAFVLFGIVAIFLLKFAKIFL